VLEDCGDILFWTQRLETFIYCIAVARTMNQPDMNMYPFAAQNKRELLKIVKNLSGASKHRPFLAMLQGVAHTFNKELEELTLLDLTKLGSNNFPVGRANLDYVERLYHNLGLELKGVDAKEHFLSSLHELRNSMIGFGMHPRPPRKPCANEMWVAHHVVEELLQNTPPMSYEELRLFIKQSDLHEQIYHYLTLDMDEISRYSGLGFENADAGCTDDLVITIYNLLDSLCMNN
jgi:hypothetical protein